MVTYYNKRDLIEFGNYLLSDERKEGYKVMTKEAKKLGCDPLPTKERLKQVGHADYYNWIENKKNNNEKQ